MRGLQLTPALYQARCPWEVLEDLEVEGAQAY